jgi:hypothetical protein
MAKRHAKTGALYFTPRINAITIAFTDDDPDTITDSDNGFVDAGFKEGDLVTVSGSTSNDGNYTIDTGGVAAGVLTLVIGDSLTAEIAGDNVTIFTALPGQLVAGFYGWGFTDVIDVVEVTDFVDGAAGFKKYITGLKDWTGDAAGYWLTDDFHHYMIGKELIVQFFEVYNTAPNVTTVHLLRGKCIVTGIDVDSDVNDAIHENLSFQGTGTAEIQGTGIAFVDGGGGADTITDTGNGFIRAGFQEGHKITVSGSTTSDGDYPIVSVVAGTITLATGSLPGNEAAGDVVSISAQIQLVPRTTAWAT